MKRTASIDTLNLKSRTSNTLKRYGIFTISTLLKYSGIELRRLDGFGKLSKREVEEILSKNGFELKKEKNK